MAKAANACRERPTSAHGCREAASYRCRGHPPTAADSSIEFSSRRLARRQRPLRIVDSLASESKHHGRTCPGMSGLLDYRNLPAAESEFPHPHSPSQTYSHSRIHSSNRFPVLYTHPSTQKIRGNDSLYSEHWTSCQFHVRSSRVSTRHLDLTVSSDRKKKNLFEREVTSCSHARTYRSRDQLCRTRKIFV